MLEFILHPMRDASSALAWVLAPTESEAMVESEMETKSVDLRCVNEACTLFALKLEPDEITPEPDGEPDRCAECGQPLGPYLEGRP